MGKKLGGSFEACLSAVKRTQTAPAPLLEDVKEALRRFAQDCPTCTDTVRRHISDLTRRLAGAEQSEHDFRNEAQEVYTDRDVQKMRGDRAEARVRELEKAWAFVAGDIVEMNSCEGMHRLLAAVGLTWPGEITIDPTSPIVWEQKCKEAETRIMELEAKIEELDGYAKGIVDMILATTETESETPEDGWSISALEYELDEWCARPGEPDAPRR